MLLTCLVMDIFMEIFVSITMISWWIIILHPQVFLSMMYYMLIALNPNEALVQEQTLLKMSE